MSYNATKHFLGVVVPDYSLENIEHERYRKCCLKVFLNPVNRAVMLGMKICVQVSVSE